MPKKSNNTKCRKITFAAAKRKRVLKSLYKKGRIKLNEYMYYMNIPLKSWLQMFDGRIL